VRFEDDVGEWVEYIRFRWVGERGGWRFDDPFGIWMVGGTASVAALTGGVRICSLGRWLLSRSVDLVSRRRRLGTLGRFGGGGLRKTRWEGGGEGLPSNAKAEGVEEGGIDEEEMAAGIIGRGEMCWGLSFSRSISGNTLDRAATWVSS
jgi:hypothetical protein